MSPPASSRRKEYRRTNELRRTLRRWTRRGRRSAPSLPNPNLRITCSLASAIPVEPAVVRRKVAGRVLPFVFLLYIVAYLDRANAGFAKLAMADDLKFSEEVFGLGFGIFFIGYLTLEIPGALLVERWSARKWF